PLPPTTVPIERSHLGKAYGTLSFVQLAKIARLQTRSRCGFVILDRYSLSLRVLGLGLHSPSSFFSAYRGDRSDVWRDLAPIPDTRTIHIWGTPDHRVSQGPQNRFRILDSVGWLGMALEARPKEVT